MIARLRENLEDSASNGNLQVVARWVTDCLCLAATPAFALMALATGTLGGSLPDMLCPPRQNMSPLSGMALMYWLMSAFHTAPWLKLLSGR